MPLDERMLEQNDPNMDTIVSLQRSITATLTYIMGRASIAELFGLQAYLSKRASQMAPVEAERCARQEMPAVLSQQMAEIKRQNAALQAQMEQANCTPAQYRQES